ncbi:hypothetical protein KC845_01560 [Candidatus Kaiserbacteria bacterium]|nr:hypothetical protein [Candidatus Kaiserbacteria bacterium]
MKSTKSVAPDSVEVKKKASAKVAVKKSVGKTKPKATKSRAIKKSVTKNVAKKVTIKDLAKEAKDIEHKMSKVVALHSSRKSDVNKSIKIDGKRNQNQAGRSLATLSTFRFPLDTERLAIQTARFGGLSLVLAGASLALFFMFSSPVTMSGQALLGCVNTLDCLAEQQQAELAEKSSSSQQDLEEAAEWQQRTLEEAINEQKEALNTAVETQQQNLTDTTQTTSQSVSQPPAVFTVGSPEPLDGVVPITITVADAEAITITVYYEKWNKNITLGSAKFINGTWSYEWNTKNFEDGNYKLKALIKNSTGSYEQLAKNYVEVKHAPVPEVEEEVKVADDGDLEVKLSSDAKSLTVSQMFGEITSKDKVIIYLINRDTNRKILLKESLLFPLAYLQFDVFWKEVIAVSGIETGNYKLYIERIRDGKVVSQASTNVTLTYREPLPPAPVETVDSSAHLTVLNASSLNGFADVIVEVPEADFVELYAVNTASVNSFFLGLARKTSNGIWLFNWDTTQTPNSKYHVFAVVGKGQDKYESNRVLATINNVRISQPTPNQTTDLAKREEVYNEVIGEDIFYNQLLAKPDASTTPENLLEVFKTENTDRLNEQFQKYAIALRSGNDLALTTANTRLQGIQNEFKRFVRDEEEADELVLQFNEYIAEVKDRIKIDIAKIDKILTERDAESLQKDTDFDGVTDFDELYIYGTDPFQADTSGNGVPDGVAILNGLDPLSTEKDQSIVFESPKETGIIREDLLLVESVLPVTPDTPQQPETAVTPAVITGKALPNSFVTLYIFSNPVVVTVKTEADGSWQYRFEKELDDGSHSVYVALTDNSGRIIARSLPFNFIKEAQAFTPVSNENPLVSGIGSVSTDYKLFSPTFIYLVLSFAVVAVGLVLLLTGMFLNSRRKEYLVSDDSAITAV